jgi:hypothetical protein
LVSVSAKAPQVEVHPSFQGGSKRAITGGTYVSVTPGPSHVDLGERDRSVARRANRSVIDAGKFSNETFDDLGIASQ